MSKRVIKIITLIMVIAMVASLAVGCGGDKGDASSAGSSSGSNGGNGAMDGINATSEEIEALRGTTVTYVTWKDPEQNEDGVAVKKFEEKYGITVNVQLVDQSTYVNTIATDIAAGQQGDVFFENGDFPGSLTVMQPLDAANFDLSDPIWNQALIKASTLEGHAYLVDAISNVWTEVDLCVYNKSLFELANIPTPDKFYEQGKWTFENFRWCAEKISALGKQYMGAGMLGESVLGAAGSSVFTYKDNKMISTVDDHLIDVMKFVADMKSDGIAGLQREDFGNGTVGMALTNCFGLKKTGYFTNINPDHLGATYLPKWSESDKNYVTGIYRGWGLIDGAKNPVGAGLFLREYLDVNNYDLSNTFHNEEVSSFFFQVTGAYSENMIYYHGPDMVKTTGIGSNFHEAWNYTTSANMKAYFDSQANVIEEMCVKANKIIDQERDYIKKTFG